MSLATWKAEFYPTEASECPKEEAIEHSLRKWRGLRKQELQRHEVAIGGKGLNCIEERREPESPRFWVTADTCALCERFYDDRDDDEPCKACPLAISRGGVSCDDETGIEKFSPYAAFSDYADPEPMIAALEKALADKNGSKA